MRIDISAKAGKQIATIDAWWRVNRIEAPALFSLELVAALRLIAANPRIGTLYRARPETRRLLLRRTRYHLYVYSSDDCVTVVAVWSARRKGPPR